MRIRGFSEWKVELINKLIKLRNTAVKDNEKARNDIDTVLMKLQYAKKRDLSTILVYIHILIKEYGLDELVYYLPSDEELNKWFKEGVE